MSKLVQDLGHQSSRDVYNDKRGTVYMQYSMNIPTHSTSGDNPDPVLFHVYILTPPVSLATSYGGHYHPPAAADQGAVHPQ